MNHEEIRMFYVPVCDIFNRQQFSSFLKNNFIDVFLMNNTQFTYIQTLIISHYTNHIHYYKLFDVLLMFMEKATTTTYTTCQNYQSISMRKASLLKKQARH